MGLGPEGPSGLLKDNLSIAKSCACLKFLVKRWLRARQMLVTQARGPEFDPINTYTPSSDEDGRILEDLNGIHVLILSICKLGPSPPLLRMYETPTPGSRLRDTLLVLMFFSSESSELMAVFCS